MSDLFQNASDDQLALTLCFAAVTVSGLVMYFSYHVGVFARGLRSQPGTLRISEASKIPAAEIAQPREKAA